MIQVSEVVRADDGYGFNITNGYSVPLVHFTMTGSKTLLPQ